MSAAKSSPLAVESDLPEGWASAALHELAVHVLGGQWGVAPDEEKAPDLVCVKVLRGTEFRNWDKDKGATGATRLVPNASLLKRELQLGDLVVEISGGGPEQPVGRTLLIDDTALHNSDLPLICSNFCRQVRLHKAVDSAFVAWSLRLQYSRGEFNKFQTETTNIRNLNFNEFAEEIEIPLGPLAEQQRIVERVEQLLARVNAARERLARAPAILKRFRQAVLAAACSGRLTADWRDSHPMGDSAAKLLSRILAERRERVQEWGTAKYAQPRDPDEVESADAPEEWAITNFDQVTCLVTSGSRGWAKYYSESGPLFIRAQDINTDQLRLYDAAHVLPPDNAEGRRTQVQFGDLLITITGANVTKSARVDKEIGEAYVSQHIALARPVDPSVGQFLYLWVISPLHGRAKLLNDAYGAGKPGLNLDNIKQIVLALPSLEEQREIALRVDALFNLATTIEKRVAGATARAEKLTQAILAKAFRGELVPTEAELARREGRSYEPASALLARIHAERGSPRTPSRNAGREGVPHEEKRWHKKIERKTGRSSSKS